MQIRFGSRIGLGLGILLQLAGSTASAVDLGWSGQLRVRGEGGDRSFLGRRFEWDTLQRTRVGIEARVAPEIRLFVQAQDSRAWGSEGNTLANTRNLDLHQAYGELEREGGGVRWRIRAGRQELVYGDERIIGPVGFSNVGRSFDAVQVRMSKGRLTSDVVAARLADDTQGSPRNDDLYLSYNRFASTAGDRGGEAYVLHRSNAGIFETTIGERLFATHGRVQVVQELAFQTGRRAHQDIVGFLGSGQAYVRASGRVTIGGGLDFFTGDDPGDADLQFFDSTRLFATAHKFYGRMDVVEALASKGGLLDPYGVVLLRAPRDVKARLEVHAFRSQQKDALGTPLPPSTTLGAHLGTEIDLLLGFPVAERTGLEFLVTGFLVGESLADRGLGSRDAVWGYASMTFDF